jgi:hypothetical protein
VNIANPFPTPIQKIKQSPISRNLIQSTFTIQQSKEENFIAKN